MNWLPMETAPVDGTEIRLRLKSGREITARMQPGFIGSDEQDCSCWVCVDDKHPKSWTDGACWASNDEEKPSDPPTRWQPPPLKGRWDFVSEERKK